MRIKNPDYGAGVQSGRGGFTLVELLTVVAVIAILTGIGFGVLTGVHERAATGKARSELAALAQALEAFRAHWGDYPKVITANYTSSDAGQALYSALNGQADASGKRFTKQEAGAGGAMVDKRDSDGDVIYTQGRIFIRKSVFSLKRSKLIASEESKNNSRGSDEKLSADNVDNVILDPWGRAYRYYYDPSDVGLGGKYLLFSVGAKTVATEDDVGVVLRAVQEGRGLPRSSNNASSDNIYANE